VSLPGAVNVTKAKLAREAEACQHNL